MTATLCTLCLLLITAVILITGINSDEETSGSEYWREIAYKELRTRLSYTNTEKRAKNVILFLGDGMGPVAVTAARFYLAKSRDQRIEDTHFAWDKFPFTGIAKPYITDRMVADSAAAATAYLCGVKTSYAVIGMDQFADKRSCEHLGEHSVDSILTVAKREGKKTGLVTNTRITHATPAASYAHAAHRYYESGIPDYVSHRDQCKDIARQLVDDTEFNVIFGGGRSSFKNQTSGGKRTDGRDLLNVLMERNSSGTSKSGTRFQYVETAQQLRDVDPTRVGNIIGLFADDMMDYEYDRLKNEVKDQPSLKDMTLFALEALQHDNTDGYVLVVEGGRIDHAHHDNNAFRAFNETAIFSDTIEMVMGKVNKDDTLVVVTADHGQAMIMGSYPPLDGDILGFADAMHTRFLDDKPVLAVNYITGRGHDKHRKVNGKDTPRLNLTGVDTTAPDFIQDAMFATTMATHGGQDVSMYAWGPGADLFTGVHEQHYIYHAMAYVGCLGGEGKEAGLKGGVVLRCRSRRAAIKSSATTSTARTTYDALHCMAVLVVAVSLCMIM